MALKASTQEKCSCVSPDSSRFLSSKKRQGAYITCARTESSVSIRICVVNSKQSRNYDNVDLATYA